MEYLEILQAIRSVTADRAATSFPALPTPTLRCDGSGHSVVIVVDAALSRAVLESPRYEAWNFLDRILTVVRPEKTRWIRRFCELSPIMVDGPEHVRRRALADTLIDGCMSAVKDLPPAAIGTLVEDGLARPGASAALIASDVVAMLLGISCSTCLGRTVSLPRDELLAIEFFNPFPTLSALARCDDAIAACCQAIGLESEDEAVATAVLSLLTMGVRPLHAVTTQLIDAWLAGAAAGDPPEAIREQLAMIDAYAVVPVNFVMRRCIEADTVAAEEVSPGDVVYCFLGSATGCPFTRQSAVPFGAGAHVCSGMQLSIVMFHQVRRALLGLGMPDGLQVVPSRPSRGIVNAFLTYPLK
jgi:cytochrome P450